MPASIAPTWRAIFLWGSGLLSDPYGSSASCMTARLHLRLLLAGVRDAFFRSVFHSPCLPDLQTRVPKLARGTEACVPDDSGSNSPTSAQLMQCVRPVFFVVLPLLLVLLRWFTFRPQRMTLAGGHLSSFHHRYRRTSHPRRLEGGPSHHVEQT